MNKTTIWFFIIYLACSISVFAWEPPSSIELISPTDDASIDCGNNIPFEIAVTTAGSALKIWICDMSCHSLYYMGNVPAHTTQSLSQNPTTGGSSSFSCDRTYNWCVGYAPTTLSSPVDCDDQSRSFTIGDPDYCPPDSPTSVNANPGGDGEIRVTWSGGGPDYELRRDGTTIDDDASSPYIDSGLSSGDTFCYSVRSYDSSCPDIDRYSDWVGGSGSACDTCGNTIDCDFEVYVHAPDSANPGETIDITFGVAVLSGDDCPCIPSEVIYDLEVNGSDEYDGLWTTSVDYTIPSSAEEGDSYEIELEGNCGSLSDTDRHTVYIRGECESIGELTVCNKTGIYDPSGHSFSGTATINSVVDIADGPITVTSNRILGINSLYAYSNEIFETSYNVDFLLDSDEHNKLNCTKTPRTGIFMDDGYPRLAMGEFNSVQFFDGAVEFSTEIGFQAFGMGSYFIMIERFTDGDYSNEFVGISDNMCQNFLVMFDYNCPGFELDYNPPDFKFKLKIKLWGKGFMVFLGFHEASLDELGGSVSIPVPIPSTPLFLCECGFGARGLSEGRDLKILIIGEISIGPCSDTPFGDIAPISFDDIELEINTTNWNAVLVGDIEFFGFDVGNFGGYLIWSDNVLNVHYRTSILGMIEGNAELSIGAFYINGEIESRVGLPRFDDLLLAPFSGMTFTGEHLGVYTRPELRIDWSKTYVITAAFRFTYDGSVNLYAGLGFDNLFLHIGFRDSPFSPSQPVYIPENTPQAVFIVYRHSAAAGIFSLFHNAIRYR